MDVDTEEKPLQRFELAKSVVAALPRAPTNQEDDNINSDGDEEPGFEYVTHMDRSCSDGQLAAALTSREIKLYARDTMLQGGELAGHTGALTQLAYAPSDDNALFSASEDGTVRGWDTRSGASTFKFGQSGEEIWSMALGYDGHLCAAGKGCTVEFFDLRKSGTPLGTYSECHTDAVTQLCFHPHKHSFLLTGSEDGLMCYFDTGVSSEEDALDSVMNAECAVRTVGFFGSGGEGVYCCSNTETLSLWHASGAQRIADFGDVRVLARGEKSETEAGAGDGDSKTSEGEPGGKEWGVPVDSIVGCRYDSEADRLWLVTGRFEGGACLATVSPGGITPEAVLAGGHSEQVRAFDWLGKTIATGGEDAKVCLWRVPGSGSAVGGGEEDDDAMGDSSGAGAAREGGVAQGGGVAPTASGARRAENRAARTFRPYDTDGRGR